MRARKREAAATSGDGIARVGPNAIIQTLRALDEIAGPDVTDGVLDRARLAAYRRAPPHGMVDEREVSRLFAAVLAQLSPEQACTVLKRSGELTGAYILANRIPPLARRALQALPAVLSIAVLRSAIVQHAWTFCGSGRVTSHGVAMVTITIAHNPIPTPGCAWHTAVFETLFRDVAGAGVTVTHACCSARGEGDCVFEVVRASAASQRQTSNRTASTAAPQA